MHKFTILACSLLKALFTGKDDTSIFSIIGNTQALFLFTLLTSILSASFGMANSLKIGVCLNYGKKGTTGWPLHGEIYLFGHDMCWSPGVEGANYIIPDSFYKGKTIVFPCTRKQNIQLHHTHTNTFGIWSVYPTDTACHIQHYWME